MNDELYEKAKAVPIRDVLTYYDIPIHKDKINCLVHDEKTPSAHIYDQNDGDNHIKCFGCHENYDGIAIVMKMENMQFVEALNFLGNNFTAETFVAKPKRDLNFYFYLNKELRQLVLSGYDVSVIKKYAQMIDMFNIDKKIMLLMYGALVAKLRIGEEK